MIIPIRCISCGKVLADKWKYYQKQIKEMEEKHEEDDKSNKHFELGYKGKILDDLKLYKICCRRVMLTHVDLIDII